MRLANKVAIVTGSGHGIGREMAFVLADEGASVVVTARTRSEIDAVAKEIRAKSGKALAIPTDVRVEEQVNGMVQKTIDEFGKIDILVNNAGGALNSFYTLVVDLKFEDWKEVQEANVTGTFLCSKAVLPHMIKRRSGVIINLSSSMGKQGRAGASAYCAAKHAIEGFTHALHHEVFPLGIRVNAMGPGGLTATPGMIKYHKNTLLEKMLDPKIVRDLLIYLASDDSAGVSGQSISANTWMAEQKEVKELFSRSKSLKETLR